jgi:hypothetical protein
MKLFEEFKLYETMWDEPLTEAKADTEKLIAFAGEELAAKFLELRKRLKAPENDLYYWIKKKTPEELEKTIKELEANGSNTKVKKEVAAKGAKLVSDTANWKVYHITSFEAARAYGRDTKWCITGLNNTGDRYWKDYTGRGAQFYFLITNNAYDARGTDSKIALAIYPNNYCEVFNQQDDKISLSDIPHLWEVSIPGIDLGSLSQVKVLQCIYCQDPVTEATYYLDPNGEYCCETCFKSKFFYCPDCGRIYDLKNLADEDEQLCKACISK